MAVNRELMEELRVKCGVENRQLQRMIKRIVDESGDTISREVATLVLAADKKIGISRYATSQEELDRVRAIRSERSTTPVMPLPKIRGKPEKEKPPRPMHFDKGLKVTDPFLPLRIQNEAQRMSEIYGLVYIFENSVRNIIKTVLDSIYGDDWWDSHVPPKIKEKVRDNINKEKTKPWHGKRGQHEIFYTVIGDLKKILSRNSEVFEPILHDLNRVNQLIDKIETSRHVIAHNNPLDKHDIDRLRINFEDWMRIITNSRDQIEQFQSITT